MEHKFKVGDMVRVKNNLIVSSSYDGCLFTKYMSEYCGNTYVIQSAFHAGDGIPLYKLENTDNWSFSDSMLEEATPSRYEFKVGDRINHKKYGLGTIIRIDTYCAYSLPYVVEFDKDHRALWSCGEMIASGRGLWCREDEIELTIEDVDSIPSETPPSNLDTLVKKIIEITENSPVTFDFYSNSIAVELYESAIIIQYITKTNTVFLDLELSDGKIDTETLMQAAKVMEVLEQNKVLLKEFCTK